MTNKRNHYKTKSTIIQEGCASWSRILDSHIHVCVVEESPFACLNQSIDVSILFTF